VNSTGATSAPESWTIWANRKTASSKRLLKPCTNTSTCRFGDCFRARPVQAPTPARSTGSARRATKSVVGLPGSDWGHCTEPASRVASGGIETTRSV